MIRFVVLFYDFLSMFSLSIYNYLFMTTKGKRTHVREHMFMNTKGKRIHVRKHMFINIKGKSTQKIIEQHNKSKAIKLYGNYINSMQVLSLGVICI